MIKNINVAISENEGPLGIFQSSLNEPTENQVQIKVYRSGVSLGEITKAYSNLEKIEYPWTPGFDVTGIITKVGSNVSDLNIGDKVVSLCMDGGYTKYINLNSNIVIPINETVDFNIASAIVTNYLTAYQMITRACKLNNNMKVLIHGAAGGLGSALLDLCQSNGIKPYCTVSTGKIDFIKKRGGIPINYKESDFVEEILSQEPDGIDIVFETIGIENAKKSFKCLKASGKLILSGFVELKKSNKSLLSLLFGFISLKLKNMNRKLVFFRATPTKKIGWYRNDLRKLFSLAEEGLLSPQVDSVYSYVDANDAFNRVLSGKAIGKVLLNMDS